MIISCSSDVGHRSQHMHVVYVKPEGRGCLLSVIEVIDDTECCNSKHLDQRH